MLIALSAFAMLLAGCEKDEEDQAELTMTSLAGTYKVLSMTAQFGTSGPAIDIYSQMDACQKDDSQVLNANGTYSYMDDGTECSPSNDATGTWSVVNTTITMDGDTYTIESFDGDKLTVSSPYVFQGTTYTLTVVMDKQ